MKQSLSPNKTTALKKERLFSKDYILIMYATMSTSFMNILFSSSTALHISALGGLQVQAGLLVTVNTMSALIIRPVSGVLSDKIGRVKLLIAGAIMCSVGCILYGLAGAIMMLLIIRVIVGLGFGMHSTCAGAVAADVLPKSRLAEGIGIYGMGTTLAQALAPLIAVSIIGDGALPNFRTLFFFMAVLCIVCAVADCCITYERKAKKEKSHAETAGGDLSDPAGGSAVPAGPAETPEPPQKTILGFEYVVFAPMAVMALMFMGSAALNTFVVPFGRGIGIANPGYFYMVSASGMFISRLVFGKVADRFGNDVVIIPGFIVLITGLALLPSAGSLPVFLTLALPIGLAQGAVSPTFNSLLFKRSSPSRRGSASGAAWSATDVGYAIGTPLLGLLADARDYRYVFWAGSISIAAALALYVIIASDRVYNKKRNINSLVI